jgi:hypothetical protein
LVIDMALNFFSVSAAPLSGRPSWRQRIHLTLVFSFVPRPNAQFKDHQKYVELLRGTISLSRAGSSF